jgi:hypothetical protein
MSITGNAFINLRAGSLRLYAARRCFVSSNLIVAPDDSIFPPVALGPVGPGANQRCTQNRVCHNSIYYNQGSAIPAIFEDASIAAFVATDVNSVFGNVPLLPPGTAAIEFQKDVNSGSTVYSMTPWP